MRFFAFLSVFFFHSLPGNDLATHVGRARLIALAETTVHAAAENGVALFFLLSAFLITELLRREKLTTGTIQLKLFYVRRSLRIWPLYYLAVVIGLLVQPLSPIFHLSGFQVLTYLFFIKNWEVALHGWVWNPIYILWTVSSEEQFYLLWPLAQKLLNARRMIVMCVVSFVAIALVSFWPGGVFYRHQSIQQIYLFLYFPLGAFLSFTLQGRRGQQSMARSLAMAGAGLMLWLLGTRLGLPNGQDSATIAMLATGKMVILAGTVLIFFAFLKSDPARSPQRLIYLGKISYGLYVFHMMAVLLAAKMTDEMGLLRRGMHSFQDLALGLGVRLSIAMAITIVTAGFSYEFFEKYFLRWKDKWAIVPSEPVESRSASA